MSLQQAPRKWYVFAARAGLTAKGIVYCLSGLIAFAAALHLTNNSTKDAGKKGVFTSVQEIPFGRWLVLVIAVGLICYIIWRWIEAFADTEEKGTDKKGIAKRFTYFWSGLLYTGAAVYAVKLFFGSKDDNKSNGQGWMSSLMQKDWGEWIIYAIAFAMIGIGVYQVYRAISGKYKKYVRDALHNDTAPWIIAAGVAGYTARGLVWMIIGILFIKAASHSNANEAGGSDKAFGWLQQNNYGTIALVIVAVGLICYGIFMFLRAVYQRFK